MTTFIDYLKSIHAKDYQGTDDDMSDSFDAWLERQDGNDLIDHAEQMVATQNKRIEKLMELIVEAIGELNVIKEMAKV
ncbi:MAG: hypothetical protein NUV80_00865 [Candidatus Berkelbacteria bacterium]|nr:hypothetical protein [Candidatus Berkelbacteria bacterium]